MSSIENLLVNELAEYKDHELVVAYSGGVDSHVLLHAVKKTFPDKYIRAIHVHHGLQAESDAWVHHCQSQCRSMGIEIDVHYATLVDDGRGTESMARQARYHIFENALEPGQVLLMAHHLDDQIETLFLRLFRGTGPEGLAGMPRQRVLGSSELVRPLLTLGKADIEDYAREHSLHWVIDNSNRDSQFDRNFIRNELLPLAASRWPMYRKTIGRLLGLMTQPEGVSQQISEQLQHRLTADMGLKVIGFEQHELHEQAALIREWIRLQQQSMPSQEALLTLLTDVIGARADASPLLNIGDYQVRRFKSAIYLTREWPLPDKGPHRITPGETLNIVGSGQISLVPESAADVRRPVIKITREPLSLRFAVRLPKVQPAGRQGSRDMKRLLQEYRVKPWMRDRLPLLFQGERLLAVADLFVTEGNQAEIGDDGFRLIWESVTL